MDKFDLVLIKEFLEENYAEFQMFLAVKEIEDSEAEVIIGDMEKEIDRLP